MAEIFLARERGSDEFIVIKRLLGHISEHPGLVQMFLDEARVAATLQHPNIVKIYNVGTVNGQFFLSMEHLKGLDLSKLNREMRRQKRMLPIRQVLYVCHGIAKALDYAHNHVGKMGEPLEIVHRDLSPHNVFVTLEGVVKLLDFGVAKASNALHKTKTGALVGKLAYMSPEHLNNDLELDGRSDLFSLGIVMWELSLGQRLYNTKKLGEFEVLRRITEEPVPDPTQFRKDYPPVVREILNRALRKDRDERFQSARAFASAIEAAATSLGFELGSDCMAEFVEGTLPDVVERITSSIRRLERSPLSTTPTGARYTPSALSQPSLVEFNTRGPATPGSGSIPGLISGSIPGATIGSNVASPPRLEPNERPPEMMTTPVELINPSAVEDEERTEQRIRGVRRVTWNQLPKMEKPEKLPNVRGSALLPLVLVALVLGGVIALVLAFGS